jgi:hypothetical protein
MHLATRMDGNARSCIYDVPRSIYFDTTNGACVGTVSALLRSYGVGPVRTSVVPRHDKRHAPWRAPVRYRHTSSYACVHDPGIYPLLLVYTQLWAGPVQRMSIVTAITSPGGPAVYGHYVYAQRSRDGGPQFPRTQQDRCFADYYSEYGVPVEKEEYLEPTPST